MRDVHDDQATRDDPVAAALGEHRGDPAEGGADEDRRAAELVGDRDAVSRVRGERVVAVERPLAVSVPAQVEGDGLPAGLGEDAGGGPPGVARLPAAVHEHHRPARLVAPHVRDQVNAFEAFEPSGSGFHERILARRAQLPGRWSELPNRRGTVHAHVEEGSRLVDYVKFHFDPRCPWCYQTSRWANRLAQLGEIDLDWGVFSLEVANLPEDEDPRELHAVAVSGPALRTAIGIRDRDGSRAIGPFYAALGARIWEQPPPPDDMVAAVRAALEQAQLDPSIVDAALADPSSWDAVLAEHQALVDRTGAFGVPTIVIDSETGPAIFGPVVSRLPSDEDAVELWHHTRWLLRNGNFAELERGRSSPPDLATMDHYRREREKAKASA